jgi:hypothetical protein
MGWQRWHKWSALDTSSMLFFCNIGLTDAIFMNGGSKKFSADQNMLFSYYSISYHISSTAEAAHEKRTKTP